MRRVGWKDEGPGERMRRDWKGVEVEGCGSGDACGEGMTDGLCVCEIQWA